MTQVMDEKQVQMVIEQKYEKEVVYESGGEEVKLNPSIVSQFITKGNTAITMAEAVNFIQLCKYSQLNPFLNEAYLIKYATNKPADMVVAKEALLKRANRQENFKGYKAGVIVEDADGNVVYKKGQFVSAKEKLVGGWAQVFRSDIDFPYEVEVGLEEYNTYKSTWKKMPANMIRKVALANALREAYPEVLGSMKTEDEPNDSDHSSGFEESNAAALGNKQPASMLEGFNKERVAKLAQEKLEEKRQREAADEEAKRQAEEDAKREAEEKAAAEKKAKEDAKAAAAAEKERKAKEKKEAAEAKKKEAAEKKAADEAKKKEKTKMPEAAMPDMTIPNPADVQPTMEGLAPTTELLVKHAKDDIVIKQADTGGQLEQESLFEGRSYEPKR